MSTPEWAPQLMRYTEEQWQQEMNADDWIPVPSLGGFCFGTSIPCPDCGTVGFYGPRLEEEQKTPQRHIIRKYRMCKFCGFGQEAWGYVFRDHGGTPYRCNYFACDKCPGDGWRPPWMPGNERCPNENCKAEMRQRDWPTRDALHRYHTFEHEIAEVLRRRASP